MRLVILEPQTDGYPALHLAGWGVNALRSWRDKSNKASTYLEVGRSVKSVWRWVETKFCRILMYSEIKGPSIY